MNRTVMLLGGVVAAAGLFGLQRLDPPAPPSDLTVPPTSRTAPPADPIASPVGALERPADSPARPVAYTPPTEATEGFLDSGIEWLANAQYENGGWGAGSHSHQDVRDPHAVQVDPATTAFSAMALLRTGSTLEDGPYHTQVRRALDYLLGMVEGYSADGIRITDLQGTQPQVKLGQNIDVSMVAQFFTRVLPHTRHEPALEARVHQALDRCLMKLTRAQGEDGSWNDRGGWAAVLQSAMANNALEMAAAAGVEVDQDVLDKSRTYQKGNVDAESGTVRTEAAAGVSLYSITSSQRASAQQAGEARRVIDEAREQGRIEASEPVSEDNLTRLGIAPERARDLADAYRQNEAAKGMLQNESVMAGFGNNGGEEFLSYMMTSESLVLSGGDDWTAWQARMQNRLAAVQNPDGSWSGHHCITSPVFCTAAVIMTLSADRDRDVLLTEQQSASGD